MILGPLDSQEQRDARKHSPNNTVTHPRRHQFRDLRTTSKDTPLKFGQEVFSESDWTADRLDVGILRLLEIGQAELLGRNGLTDATMLPRQLPCSRTQSELPR